MKRRLIVKQIHRDILQEVEKGNFTYNDLGKITNPDFYKKAIGFNPWNLYLAVDFLIHKKYIFINSDNSFNILELTEKGKHYYDVMLKVNK